MLELVVRQNFESAHVVVGHKGKCGRLHGHNWAVDVFIKAKATNEIGIAVDFADIKTAVKEIITPLDHVYLNELPAFSGDTKNNPTAENVAKYIFKKLHKVVEANGAELSKITIWETDGSAASFFLAPGESLSE